LSKDLEKGGQITQKKGGGIGNSGTGSCGIVSEKGREKGQRSSGRDKSKSFPKMGEKFDKAQTEEGEAKRVLPTKKTR